MRLRYLPLVVALGAATTASACGASQNASDATGPASDGGGARDSASTDGSLTPIDPARVQMNDVSVLLPLPSQLSDLDGSFLHAGAAGLGGSLLPQTIYDAATGEDGDAGLAPGGQLSLPWSGLRVVGARIDPCFANIGPVTDSAKCENQLRLVLQVFSTSVDGNVQALDGAVHAFYSLTRDDLLALVKGVVALRNANGPGAYDLGPLALHPIAVAQGPTGAFVKGLNALILTHAGAQNFMRFTRFAAGNGGRTWTFHGFDVAAGAATDMVIPSLTGSATQVSFFQGFSDDLEGQFTPETTSKDDISLLGNIDEAEDADPTDQQAAIDAAFRIENPNRHSPNTIDCASCHVAGPARVLVGKEIGLGSPTNPNAFTLDSPFVPAADMVQTTPVVNDGNGVSLHVFSYKDGNAMIAMRAVNETASIVAYLNGLTP